MNLVSRNNQYQNGPLQAFADINATLTVQNREGKSLSVPVEIKGGKILSSNYGCGSRFVLPQHKSKDDKYRSDIRITSQTDYRDFSEFVAEDWKNTAGKSANAIQANADAQKSEEVSDEEIKETLTK